MLDVKISSNYLAEFDINNINFNLEIQNHKIYIQSSIESIFMINNTETKNIVKNIIETSHKNELINILVIFFYMYRY